MSPWRCLGIYPVVATLVVVTGASGWAQEATRGEIRGAVKDSAGLVLPGVTVTAVHVETGEIRTGITGEAGLYRLLALALGTHTVTLELPGFATVRREGITVRIGQSVTVDVTMEVGGLEETVTVAGGAPLIETRTAEVAGLLEPAQIQNLPLMGRHWMELGLLMPGITSTDVSSRGIASGRGDDRDQAVYIDGTDARNECCSRTSGSHSQDAIAEFKVVTNNYSAEFGRSVSFVLTAVTKSGTNVLHGTGFYFFRDEQLDSADFFTKKVEPFDFSQWGGSVGGPIRKDRLFFFGSYERQYEAGTAFSNTGFRQLDEIAVNASDTQNYVLGKVDWLVASQQRLSAKYYYWDSDDLNGRRITQVGGRQTFASVPNNLLHNYGTVVNHTWSSQHWVNEATFGYIWTDWFLHAVAEDQGIPIRGGGFRPSDHPIPNLSTPSLIMGGAPNHIQDGIEFKYEVKNTFSRVFDWHGGHDFKVGGGFIHGRNDLGFPRSIRGELTFVRDPIDPFDFNSYPEPTRFQMRLYRPGASATCRDDYHFETTARILEDLGSCAPYTVVPVNVYSVFAQDNWRLNPDFTLNLGLRYDLESGNMLPNYLKKFKPGFDPQLPHPTKSDRNNFAPRASLTYRVGGSDDTVIRGGGGMFFGASIADRSINKLVGDGWNVVTADQPFPTRQPCFKGHTLEEAITQNRNLLLPGCGTLSFDEYLALGGAQAVVALDPNMDENRAIHVNIGIARALTDDLGLDVDFVYQRYGPYNAATDTNLFFNPATGGPKDPAVFGRPDPRFTSITTMSDFGKYERKALEVRVNKRYRQGYQVQASYTLASDRDTPSNHTSRSIPDNPFNLNEWGPAEGSQRHRLTVNGILDLPWGLQLSGIFRTFSGVAYADLVRGDGWNLGRGSTRAIRQPDGSVVTIPRNSNRGLPYAKLDLRVTKWLMLGGADRKVGLIAELFNVFNHKNYGAYGSIRGTATYQKPTRSLASAFQPRQAQLGVRVNF